MTRGHSPLRLPVRTESGQALGSVVDVSIDPETHTIIFYHVKPNRLVPDVMWSPLLIHRHQVISIAPGGLVVDDAVLRSQQPGAAPAPSN